MFTGTHDKLVDKYLFITMLTQLKAAALVQVLQNYLLSYISCQSINETIKRVNSCLLTVYPSIFTVLAASTFRINHT